MKRKLKIVILEDENVTACNMREILLREGHVVAGIFHSGADTVKNILMLAPDLLIIDIILEGKINGVEFAERIGLLRNIPVVFLANDCQSSLLGNTEAWGFIAKPFSGPELLRAVDLAYYNFCRVNRIEAAGKECDCGIELQKFRRSVFSLIGYSDHLMNEIDKMSPAEIRMLAAKINTSLKIIYTLSREDECSLEAGPEWK